MGLKCNRHREVVIRKAMLVKNLRVKDVAGHLGRSHSLISLVLKGAKRSRRVEEYLSSIAGVRRNQLWTLNK